MTALYSAGPCPLLRKHWQLNTFSNSGPLLPALSVSVTNTSLRIQDNRTGEANSKPHSPWLRALRMKCDQTTNAIRCASSDKIVACSPGAPCRPLRRVSCVIHHLLLPHHTTCTHTCSQQAGAAQELLAQGWRGPEGTTTNVDAF